MSAHEVLTILDAAAAVVICVGLYTDVICAVIWIIRGGPKKRGPYRSPAIYYWLLPFYWVCFLVNAFEDHITGDRGWMVWDLIAAAIWYWLWRRSDDDRWKKLRAKAKEKVAVHGGRLVVVPVRS